METYKFENTIFTWGETESNALNDIFNEHVKDGIIIKFKKCRFNHIAFSLLKSRVTKLYFDDCNFHDASVRFVFGSEHTVVFKNCKFKSAINRGARSKDNFPLRVTGYVGPKSILRFENCTGLTKDYFTANSWRKSKEGEIDLCVTNPKCTLSYMGLHQLFKDRILNKSKEEIVYKKVAVFSSTLTKDSKGNITGRQQIGRAVATLVIPKGVARYGDRHGKCRCQYAIVREINLIPGYDYYEPVDDQCIYTSIWDRRVKYEVGKTITPDAFDLMPGECSNGIHYFYDINDAMNY